MGKGLRVGDVFNVDKGTSVDDLSNNEGALTLLSFQLGIPVNMNCVQQEDQLRNGSRDETISCKTFELTKNISVVKIQKVKNNTCCNCALTNQFLDGYAVVSFSCWRNGNNAAVPQERGKSSLRLRFSNPAASFFRLGHQKGANIYIKWQQSRWMHSCRGLI